MTSRKPDPETGVALLLLFVALPLCVAALVALFWIFWTWPVTLAVAILCWALWLCAIRWAQTKDRDGEPF